MPPGPFLLALASAVVLGSVMAATSSAAPLQDRIQTKGERLAAEQQRERVLASDVAGWSRRIKRLQDEIATLQVRQVRLQAELEAAEMELSRIQDRLRRERLRLTRLRTRLADGREALAARLVELYKADEPDYLTVILDADGYADLLQRTEFIKRVSDQDRRIIEFVQENKVEAAATTRRLDRLHERQQHVTRAAAARRDQVAAAKGRLVERREGYRSARSRKTALLAATREDRRDLEGDLRALQAESARVGARLSAIGARSGDAPTAGPVRAGSGEFIWPADGPIASSFGPRWGRLHAGVDIAAPTGTPLRATAAGRVVLLGSTGGYGKFTCIQHAGGVSSCYAHQSRYATSPGASVRQGQVIGYSGCTGRCFGDHLHFEIRVGGVPVDPAGYL